MVDGEIDYILIDEKTLQKRVKELAQKITADYPDEESELVVIGILKGSVYFFADLTRQIERPLKVEFIAVSSYGNSSCSSGEVRLVKDTDETIRGKDVIIVEDIIDTGATLKYLAALLKARSPRSVKVCALLDKPARRQVAVSADYTGFEVPDKFIVGYGLDYAQKYRNLPYVAVLKNG